MKADPIKLRIGAGLGFLAVALGAFGAHALKVRLEGNQMTEVWKTAAHYHLAHAILLVVLAYVMPKRHDGRWIFFSFAGGIVLFSGSLYAMSVTGLKWLGALTPIGGVLLLLGWVLLAMRRTE